MPNSLTPNFSTKNIVQDIQELTSLGLKGAELASKGVDWDSVVKPLDLISHEIGKSTNVNSHINSVMYSDEFNKEYEKTLPIISKYYSEMASNKGLYKAYKRVEKLRLNKQQRHIINESIKDFELSGVALKGKDNERMMKTTVKLRWRHEKSDRKSSNGEMTKFII